MTNEFEAENAVEELPVKSQELTLADFKNKNNFLRTPEVGSTMELEIVKIVNNPIISGTNKKTGKTFDIGLKDKNKKVTRYDIIATIGELTINSWEVYFKLLGKDGLLTNYAEKHDGKFTGAKISIKRLMDGNHANYKIPELAAILQKPIAEAQKYQDEVKLAMKEHRLYEVKLLD